MRKLGDQWIEIIDGQEHMFKAVLPIVNGHPDIKDLGILKDGMLPCPFCGEYPNVDEVERTVFKGGKFTVYSVEHGCTMKLSTEYRGTKQEAIDAWNRRA